MEVENDDKNIDENKFEKATKGVAEYFKINNIEWSGPFRSSFDKRLQRHLKH
jgi:hypothetical protein